MTRTRTLSEKIHEDHNGVIVTHQFSDVGLPPGHSYRVGPSQDNILSASAVFSITEINFQNGPVKEAGVNGITNEALLAVLKHRISHLNSLFPCEENDIALSGVTAALDALEARTRDRMSRGVEGKNKL